jgi:hypothetical protein
MRSRSWDVLCQPPNKQLERTVIRPRRRRERAISLCARGALYTAACRRSTAAFGLHPTSLRSRQSLS